MAFAIVVQRDLGDKPGDDIISPLVTTTPVAIDRGRQVLDSQDFRVSDERLTVLFRTGVELGQLVEVHNQERNEKWRGKISSIRHTVQSGRILTVLDVERGTL